MFRSERKSARAQEHMMRIQAVCLCSCFSALLCFLSFSSNAWGAAAVQRIREEKAAIEKVMIQRQYQQIQAQAMAQRQAQMQAQAVAYRRAQMQQAAHQKAAMEYAAYKQAMQVAIAKRNAEVQAANQLRQMVAQKQAQQVAQVQKAIAYKQASEVMAYKQVQKQRAMAEAATQVAVNQQVKEYVNYLARRKQALVQQAVAVEQVKEAQAMMAYDAYQKAAVQQQRAAIEARAGTEAMQHAVGSKIARDVLMSKAQADAAQRRGQELPEEAQTIVDIADLWNSLDQSSRAWEQIVDDEIKLLTVAEYIDRFNKLGIRIRKPPGGYVKLIDAFANQTYGFLDAPFMNILSYAAIVEYDFDNGKDKDELARQVLDEAAFLANKKRVEGR